jgi:hypothetical protein
MAEKNEIVVLDLGIKDRIILDYHIKKAMELYRLKPWDYESLGLGFDLSPEWPVEGEVTMTQLIVLAKKLSMQIRISGIEMLPMEIPAAETVNAGQD